MLWLLAAAGLPFLLLSLFGYALWRVLRPASGPPGAVRRDGDADTPVLLCLGDSLTHGHIGADWVGPLRAHLAPKGVGVANGGVNGQQAWNLLQRLDADLACMPSAVVLMIGSNDVMAAERPDRARQYVKDNTLPHTPDLPWSQEQYTALVDRLRAATPHLALCTIPPLGADESHPAEQLVRRWNDSIRAHAERLEAPLLDVHAAVWPLNAEASRPYEGSFRDVGRLLAAAGFAHYILGRSWDRIASDGSWGAMIDGIHFSDAAAARVGDLVLGWFDGLGLGE
ncbi:MAG: hypothetical protein KDA24_05760 [Deltaproteobacteria bacterium]|nr:hypothetical protein [Deltaproteobacteria bacterium]